jgi:hypothetical protein
MSEQPAVMPVQAITKDRKPATLRAEVVLRAYEVYCHVYGKQEAMVTGGCRSGFSSGEIVAMLYARTFPQNEWRDRLDEAFRDMKL